MNLQNKKSNKLKLNRGKTKVNHTSKLKSFEVPYEANNEK
tara:strand:- start:4102 stop:4221 length:120 start_codon:yes stop_codon:yes gene_type:complete